MKSLVDTFKCELNIKSCGLVKHRLQVCPQFSIFVSLLQLADLIDILSLPGPVTVFAPTNEAFDGLPTPLFKVNPYEYFLIH